MLARIVRAGQSTPRRGFGLGLARLPVETTAKPWKPQWKPSPGNHNFDNRLPLWFAPGSRKRVRTRSANLGANLPQVRTQNAYQPCVPVCALAVRYLRSYCAIRGEPSLRPNRLHPAGHNAAQCLNMLREGCVKPWRGRASRNGQVRNERARSTARKRVYRHLVRVFN